MFHLCQCTGLVGKHNRPIVASVICEQGHIQIINITPGSIGVAGLSSSRDFGLRVMVDWAFLPLAIATGAEPVRKTAFLHT